MEASSAPLPPVADKDAPQDDAASNGHTTGAEVTIYDRLRERRQEIQPVDEKGFKTIVLDVPGYDRLLGVEYKYIDTEVTERISKQVMRKLGSLTADGATLYAAIDTLSAACNKVLVRDNVKDDYRPFGTASKWQEGDPFQIVKFDHILGERMGCDAEDEREILLNVFGSEHAVTMQYGRLSQWLVTMKHEADADFLAI